VANSHLRILYDADCGFCRWSVAKLLQLDSDKTLQPLTIQSSEGQALLAQIPEAERLASAHCVDAAGKVTSGGDAFAVVAERIPGLRLTAGPARAVPGLIRGGYRLVADNRSLASRWMTPSRLAWADTVISERLFQDLEL
jgi:predicted DCC family thiol-disulfide oxidoreductase YuxK